MPKKSHGNTPPSEPIRVRRRQESERRLDRVRRRRASYQRKIIGTAVAVFIILIILCSLLPGDDPTAYGDKWEKQVNDRQIKILQSLQDNFK